MLVQTQTGAIYSTTDAMAWAQLISTQAPIRTAKPTRHWREGENLSGTNVQTRYLKGRRVA